MLLVIIEAEWTIDSPVVRDDDLCPLAIVEAWLGRFGSLVG